MTPYIGQVVQFAYSGDSFVRAAVVQYVTVDPNIVDLRVLEYGADMEDFFVGNVRRKLEGESLDDGPFWVEIKAQ